MTGRRRRRHPPRWVPNQHGAWAMLVAPFVLGAILRLRSGEPAWFLLPLFVCWLIGYVAFYNASGWLKAPPARRQQWVQATLAAGALAAASGLVALVLAGSALAWWVSAFATLTAPALVLASRRHERALIGGLLTIAAACLLTVVARFPDPAGLVGSPDAATTLVAAGGSFAYFFGTVPYVKTNVRERRSRGYYAASVGYHVAVTLVAVAAFVVGVAPSWWIIFFAATAVRAAVVPRLATPLHVSQIGFIEVGLSATLIAAFALSA